MSCRNKDLKLVFKTMGSSSKAKEITCIYLKNCKPGQKVEFSDAQTQTEDDEKLEIARKHATTNELSKNLEDDTKPATYKELSQKIENNSKPATTNEPSQKLDSDKQTTTKQHSTKQKKIMLFQIQ